jgi:integrase
MASLQARHSRTCDLPRWTTFDKAEDGCTCAPTYSVVVRDGNGISRERVSKSRRDAERALTKIQAQENEGAYVATRNVKFRVWQDEWLKSLEGPRESTIDGYRETMAYAKEALGNKDVRRLGVGDIGVFLKLLQERKLSPSTRAKHLRVLSACLDAAIVHDCAAINPVRKMKPAEKPKPEQREAAYLENDELPRLLAEVKERTYQVLFLLALKTGMRFGELAALTWRNVDLQGAVIGVRKSYSKGKVGDVKSRTSRRDVHLTDDVVKLLGEWWGESDKPDDDALVFLDLTTGGHLRFDHVLRRQLYPAIKRAGIEREGPTGEDRVFHSFRHTFAKVALENGANIFWLSRHMGHSSTQVTMKVYGHWERKAAQAETEKLAGVFGV